MRIATLLLANVVAVIVLFYVLDVFGLVSYYSVISGQFYRSMPFVPQKKRIEDVALLEKEELAKMRSMFLDRERDLVAKETKLRDKERDLTSREDDINEGKTQLAVAWQALTNQKQKDFEYTKIVKDMATKWKEMPPERTAAILQEHAKNGEDQLILDILLEMDKQARDEGGQSITPYLFSLLPPELSARLLEKYRSRSQS
ncbi:MAG: hypothetical protein AABZ39_18590 [Spirochaetota bacterium]